MNLLNLGYVVHKLNSRLNAILCEFYKTIIYVAEINIIKSSHSAGFRPTEWAQNK